MSVTLKNSPNLPRDVALRLAQDVESVALPVIMDSPVFRNSDLVELVLNASDVKQSAVAGRKALSTDVTDAIVEHACKSAVRIMSSNNDADISERGYGFTLSRFETDTDIHEALIARDWIPPQVAEKMVSLVSGQLFDMLVNHHELPPQLAIELATPPHANGITTTLVVHSTRLVVF